MLTLSRAVCPFCEASARLQSTIWLHQFRRGAATLQKKKPSRMILSSKVNQSSPPVRASSKPVALTRHSPFGGMNVTTPPREHRLPSHATFKDPRQGARSKSRTRKDDTQRDPMRALRMQQRLSSISYGQRARVKSSLAITTSFDDFALLPVVRDGVQKQLLDGLDELSPTPIQRLAIPRLLSGAVNPRRGGDRSRITPRMQQFLLAAETGSGKTLAYVLPVIDNIKRNEMVEKAEAQKAAEREEERQRRNARQRVFELPTPVSTASHPDTARPRAIILLPTAELVTQVGAVVKSLSHIVKYRAAVVSAAVTPTVIRSRLFNSKGIDIVVTTPHLISSIAEADPNILSRVEYLVIDEADSLLDRSFSPTTSAVIDRATPSLKQLILCSATIPRSLDTWLVKRYPEVQRLATPNLHAIPRRVQLSVIDIDKIPYQGNRQLACAQAIWEIGKEEVDGDEQRVKKLIVFVNERKEAKSLAEYLQSKGIDAKEFSRDAEQRESADILADFTSDSDSAADSSLDGAVSDLPVDVPGSTVAPAATSSSRSLPRTKVLVTTDIASRGIDTTPVKHVILYDVPHTSIDFLHRLGRVGRMGRRGRGIVLVGRHDRKDIVKEVREGMFRGAALI